MTEFAPLPPPDGHAAHREALPPTVVACVLLSAVLTLALAWAGMRLLDPATLPIREVRVQGALRHLDPEALRARVGEAVKGGFLDLDVDAVRSHLEREPWVGRVVVRRDWPDRLVVAVTERRAVAYWGEHGLLDEDGTAFEPPRASFPEGLPALSGPAGTERQVLERLRELEDLLAPAGLAVGALELSERRAWSFTLREGLRVVVGRRDFIARVGRFVAQYRHTVGPRLTGADTVDLRYSNGFALRRSAAAAADRGQRGLGVNGEEG